MAEEIAFENGKISNVEELVTLTLTLDRTTLHTVLHHSSTSTYTIEIEGTLCGRTYGLTFETGFIRSIPKSRPKNGTGQSSVLSPYLFTVYMRCVTKMLFRLVLVVTSVVSLFVYADDLVILTPSWYALQCF